MRIGRCVRRECQRGLRAADALRFQLGASLHTLVAQSRVQREKFRAPVAWRTAVGAGEDVQCLQHQRMPELRMIEVAGDEHSGSRVRQQRHHRRAAIQATGVECQKSAAIVLLEPAKSVAHPARLRQRRRGIELRLRDHGLWLQQLAEVRLAHQLLAVDPAAVEHEANPVRHVVGVRPDRTRGRQHIHRFVGNHANGVADAEMRLRLVDTGA